MRKKLLLAMLVGLFIFSGVYYLIFWGANDPDPYRERLFARARPHLEKVQLDVAAAGGTFPQDEYRPLPVRPLIIAQARGQAVLYVIANHPLDLDEAFVHIPDGWEIEPYLKEKAWMEQGAARTRKLADNWYWITY
jgi:hypothetical protein